MSNSTDTLEKTVFSTEEWNDFLKNEVYCHYLYHFTTLRNAINILKDKMIQAELPKTENIGLGVFFTVDSPSETDDVLIKHNCIYFTGRGASMTSAYTQNVECAFAIAEDSVFLTKITATKEFGDYNDQGIWKYPNNIDLNSIKFKVIVRKNRDMFDTMCRSNGIKYTNDIYSSSSSISINLPSSYQLEYFYD